VLQGGQVVMLLDAKYRDLWEHSLPSSWLYQMTVYAASGVGTGTAKVLYPSMSGSAKLQVIEVRNPVTGGRCAQVVLQPVHLLRLATLLDQGLSGRQARTEYLRELVFGMGSANWSGPC
jgi:5-methylcytosine-specific restriction enzyme subunit McrC